MFNKLQSRFLSSFSYGVVGGDGGTPAPGIGIDGEEDSDGGASIRSESPSSVNQTTPDKGKQRSERTGPRGKSGYRNPVSSFRSDSDSDMDVTPSNKNRRGDESGRPPIPAPSFTAPETPSGPKQHPDNMETPRASRSNNTTRAGRHNTGPSQYTVSAPHRSSDGNFYCTVNGEEIPLSVFRALLDYSKNEEPLYNPHAQFPSRAAGPSSGAAATDRPSEFVGARGGNVRDGDGGVRGSDDGGVRGSDDGGVGGSGDGGAGGGVQDEGDEGVDSLHEDARRADHNAQTDKTEAQRSLETQLKILAVLEKVSSPGALDQVFAAGPGVGRRAGHRAGHKVPRESWENKFHAQVRAKIDALIEPLTVYDDFGLDREKVEEFNERWKVDRGRTMDDHCTFDDFTFDLSSEPHSGWNASAARVFAEFFLQDEGLPKDDVVTFKAAEEAFFTRIKTLRYSLAQRGQEPAKVKHRTNSNMRKQADFDRRRLMAQRWPDLSHHLQMLDTFGPLGMSSDESVVEGGVRKYIRLKYAYRADEVTEWLHVFDRAYRVYRVDRGDVDRRGRYMRVREDRGIRLSQNRKIPISLPVNAFKKLWLKGQSSVRVSSELRPSPQAYQFRHRTAFLRYLDEREAAILSNGSGNQL